MFGLYPPIIQFNDDLSTPEEVAAEDPQAIDTLLSPFRARREDVLSREANTSQIWFIRLKRTWSPLPGSTGSSMDMLPPDFFAWSWTAGDLNRIQLRLGLMYKVPEKVRALAWIDSREKELRRTNASEDVSDEQLMASSLRGSTSAFEELYYRYARRILGFAHRLLRDHQEAESITQEVFLRLLKDSAVYDPSRRFSTWIYAIARNLCLDVLRRRRPSAMGDGDQFIGTDSDPAAEADDLETAQRLRAAIDALPPFCREVVQLRVFERLSYREIAAVVGCPESTARSRMDLAVKRLRTSFRRKLGPTENFVDGSSSWP